MDFLKRTWVEIDLDNALYNLNMIRSVCDRPLIAVIKANAYGHGAVEMARFYNENGIGAFAVSNIEEAIELRQGGVKGEILILGYTPVEFAGELAKNSITQAVFDYEYAQKLSSAAKDEIKIHIKLDTGMGRIGLDCRTDMAECLDEVHSIIELPNLKFCGIFTHFSSADSPEKADAEYVEKQYGLFKSTVDVLKSEGLKFTAHCCNSAGIMLHPDKLCDAVRPGIILYGLAPSDTVTLPVNLRPLMTLKTTVAMVKDLEKGAAVSYGRTFVSDRDMRVATLPIGYADGYLRSLSGKAEVLIKGKKAPVIGRVCMDQMMIDVTDIKDVAEGDEVVLFGECGMTANELAAEADTIGYELICGIARRVSRVYIKDKKPFDIHKMI